MCAGGPPPARTPAQALHHGHPQGRWSVCGIEGADALGHVGGDLVATVVLTELVEGGGERELRTATGAAPTGVGCLFVGDLCC